MFYSRDVFFDIVSGYWVDLADRLVWGNRYELVGVCYFIVHGKAEWCPV